MFTYCPAELFIKTPFWQAYLMKMNLFKLLCLAGLLFVSGCNPIGKMIKNQEYDRAIDKLSTKLRTGKADEKKVAYLKQAFHTANQLDHDRIMLLRASGEPDIWMEIYNRYQRIYDRQQTVKSLPEAVRQQINFKALPIEEDMGYAKSNAQEYLYASAEKLLETNRRADARKAYDQLIQLSHLGSPYRDMDLLMRKALVSGTNQVIIDFENQSQKPLPEDFETHLLAFNLSDLEFVQYDFKPDPEKTYDYRITIRLTDIVSTPERIESRTYTDKAQIESGTKPKRDEDGNIMLDSTGKVIEVPDYKTIEALVKETRLAKSLTIKGAVDYTNLATNRRELTTPIATTIDFRHAFAQVNGDLRAISPETNRLMQQRPLPFPTDWMMVKDAAEPLNEMIRNIIWKEKAIVNKTE